MRTVVANGEESLPPCHKQTPRASDIPLAVKQKIARGDPPLAVILSGERVCGEQYFSAVVINFDDSIIK